MKTLTSVILITLLALVAFSVVPPPSYASHTPSAAKCKKIAKKIAKKHPYAKVMLSNGKKAYSAGDIARSMFYYKKYAQLLVRYGFARAGCTPE